MTTPLSREYLRSLAPKREDVINAVVEYYLPEITKEAQKGLNFAVIYRNYIDHPEFLSNLPPNSEQTVTNEEFIDCLRSKCGDCEITWEIRKTPYNATKSQEVTVRW